jgi:hypothetical protein
MFTSLSVIHAQAHQQHEQLIEAAGKARLAKRFLAAKRAAHRPARRANRTVTLQLVR